MAMSINRERSLVVPVCMYNYYMILLPQARDVANASAFLYSEILCSHHSIISSAMRCTSLVGLLYIIALLLTEHDSATSPAYDTSVVTVLTRT